MKAKDLVLRCYAEQERDGTWFTMCVDLNLYSRGDTLHEAKHKLHAVIRDYVLEALTKDQQYAADLLPRPAPLLFWLRYWLIALSCKFNDAKRDRTRRRFSEPLPMIPA